jgi:hypothetical protein
MRRDTRSPASPLRGPCGARGFQARVPHALDIVRPGMHPIPRPLQTAERGTPEGAPAWTNESSTASRGPGRRGRIGAARCDSWASVPFLPGGTEPRVIPPHRRSRDRRHARRMPTVSMATPMLALAARALTGFAPTSSSTASLVTSVAAMAPAARSRKAAAAWRIPTASPLVVIHVRELVAKAGAAFPSSPPALLTSLVAEMAPVVPLGAGAWRTRIAPRSRRFWV